MARKDAALFALSAVEERMLNEVPMRGMPMLPADPLLYRFYEMGMVSGPAWKALIEEEFGDGIMLVAMAVITPAALRSYSTERGLYRYSS